MCLLQWLRRCHAAGFRIWVPPAEAIQLWLLSRGLKQLVTEIYQDCNLHCLSFGQSVCYSQIPPVISTFQVLHVLDLIFGRFHPFRVLTKWTVNIMVVDLLFCRELGLSSFFFLSTCCLTNNNSKRLHVNIVAD